MFRKALGELLFNHPMTVYDIARLVAGGTRDVERDVRHLMLTLKHSDCHVVVHPARCRKCGFVFSCDHLHKPGKCPRCKGTWIAEPMVEVVHV